MIEYIKAKHRLYQTKISFGATSAVITNLGLITGLRNGAHAKLSIIGGILIIAFADNIADSLGIHVYQEAECLKAKEVWISTFSNFVTRVIVSLIFVLLVALLPMRMAVLFSLGWGLSLLAVLSYMIAKTRKTSTYVAVLEHLVIASIVIAASNFLGKFLLTRFQL